jgi:hypothetical protein
MFLLDSKDSQPPESFIIPSQKIYNNYKPLNNILLITSLFMNFNFLHLQLHFLEVIQAHFHMRLFVPNPQPESFLKYLQGFLPHLLPITAPVSSFQRELPSSYCLK